MFSIRKLYDIFADFLFPRTERVREIEAMDAEEFVKCAPQSDYRTELSEKNIYPLFRYRNELVKEAIWQLKYKGNKRITSILAEIVYEEIVGELEDKTLFENFGNPLLIPIPISKKRLKKRGYNQMELLGNALVAIDKGRSFDFAPNILRKIKETLPQTVVKDRRLRLLNLRGCFEVNDAEKVKNRNIILIDDVLTTGSTIHEARQTLKKAGVGKVIAFTIAH